MLSFNKVIADINNGLTNDEIMVKHSIIFGDFKQVQKAIDKTIEHNPNNYKLFLNKGCIFGSKKESYFTEKEMLNGYVAPTYEEIIKEYEPTLHTIFD